MRCKSIVLPVFLIFSFFLNVCRGIDCYQCRSNVDPRCDTTDVDPKYLRTCPKTHSYCRKSNLIYYFTGSREYITVRECALLCTEGKNCYRGRYSKDSYQRVCECKDSGCNRSTNFANEFTKIYIVIPLFSQLFRAMIFS